jgi:hypothetical protein
VPPSESSSATLRLSRPTSWRGERHRGGCCPRFSPSACLFEHAGVASTGRAVPERRPSDPHCGGGRPACPSVSQREVSRVRETVGRAGRWEAVRVRWRPGAPAFWPCGPASPHRRGRARVIGEDCDRADGTPAACLVAGAASPERCTAGVARHRQLCGAWRAAGRASQAQCRARHAPKSARSRPARAMAPARPGERQKPTGSERDTDRCR